MPASLTLVEEHDGRRQAVEDARGACVGAIPLALFATTVWLTSSRTPPLLALAFATLVWGLAGLAAWTLVFGRRRA